MRPVQSESLPLANAPLTSTKVRGRNLLEPVKVGVIGIGNMGQHHARVLSRLKDVHLVGLADVNVELGIETASRSEERRVGKECLL